MEQHLEAIKVMLDYTFDRQILLEREEAQAKGIVEFGQEFGLADAAILERLQKKLDVSPEVVAGYLKQYGKPEFLGTLACLAHKRNDKGGKLFKSWK
jgi:hypothetical protein